MSTAILIINQPGEHVREMEFAADVVSIGRAHDNTISIEGDTNISRYHAVIEARGGGFWLSDLGSSNGTTVNDKPVGGEMLLRDGDVICAGGTTKIEIRLPAAPESNAPPLAAVDAPAISAADISGAPATASMSSVAAQTPSAAVPGSSSALIVTAVIGGLALTAAAAFLLIYTLGGSSSCKASVRVVSPRSGTSISDPVMIRVEAEGNKCIERVSFQLDGIEFASRETDPYDVKLDPASVNVRDGASHILTVVVEDQSGGKKVQPDTLVLDFEGRGDGTNDGGSTADANSATDSSASTTGSEASDAAASLATSDVKEMCADLAKKITTKTDYVFDRDFIHQVQDRANDYARAGYYERARKYRDTINQKFIGERGLPAMLAYVLAMSQSRFDLARGRSNSSAPPGQGLWQVEPALAQSAGYIEQCGGGKLDDADQNCSALVASAYLKALDIDLFAEDFVYAVSCFGMSLKDAGQFQSQVPTSLADRRDFWKVIKSKDQRDRVVRFFAAGIVGENPQKFGLDRDRALSALYPKK